MTKAVDLGSKFIKATQGIPRPTGIAAAPRVVLGEDATAMPAVWLYFSVDDTKAKLPKLLAFQRLVELATAKVEPSIATYIRFAPKVAAAGKSLSAPGREPTVKNAASKKSSSRKTSGKTLASTKQAT